MIQKQNKNKNFKNITGRENKHNQIKLNYLVWTCLFRLVQFDLFKQKNILFWKLELKEKCVKLYLIKGVMLDLELRTTYQNWKKENDLSAYACDRNRGL